MKITHVPAEVVLHLTCYEADTVAEILDRADVGLYPDARAYATELWRTINRTQGSPEITDGDNA